MRNFPKHVKLCCFFSFQSQPNEINVSFQPISDTSSYSTPVGWAEQNGTAVAPGAECTICYENPIDAVLYMCGHMCMCYECALQQWRGKGGGQCPLCRAIIRDVIRTYKS